MKKRGRKKITDTNYLESKATRITFRVEPEIILRFKALAAIKRINIEELGVQAIQDLFKKERNTLKKWSSVI